MKHVYLTHGFVHQPIATLPALLLCLLCSYCATAETLVVDDLLTDFSASDSWTQVSDSAQRHATTYHTVLSSTVETATASWSATVPESATYSVSVWYTDGSDRTSDAEYTVNYSNKTQSFFVDQRTGGGKWVLLGDFFFDRDGVNTVVLSNVSSATGSVVSADAVRFVREGTRYDAEYQAMWIDAWDAGFLNEVQTDTMIQVARDNNVNAIFVEIRKTGDAYYISDFIPRATNIAGNYPDPLGDMIAKCHDTSDGRQYIEVHAWIVPYRAWSASSAPPDWNILHLHPEWITYDENGNEGLGVLDPGVPDVLDHLIQVITELVEDYDVDGIHYDYFRYPEGGNHLGYNPVSINRFNARYGRSGKPGISDPDWCEFRRGQIEARYRPRGTEVSLRTGSATPRNGAISALLLR